MSTPESRTADATHGQCVALWPGFRPMHSPGLDLDARAKAQGWATPWHTIGGSKRPHPPRTLLTRCLATLQMRRMGGKGGRRGREGLASSLISKPRSCQRTDGLSPTSETGRRSLRVYHPETVGSGMLGRVKHKQALPNSTDEMSLGVVAHVFGCHGLIIRVPLFWRHGLIIKVCGLQHVCWQV